MKTAVLIIIGLIALAAVIFAVFAILAVKFFGRGKEYDVLAVLKREPILLDRVVEGRKALAAHAFEPVSITSFDGLRLDGRLYTENPDSKRFVLCFHGYHSIGHNDFAAAIDFLLSSGFNVLSVTQRAHGTSEGKYLTFGVKEKYDCVTWAKYLAARYENDIEIILDGVSMGAATVTMASDRSLGLPSCVKAMIADCGYSSPWDIVCHVAKSDYHLPAFPFIHILRFATKVVCGFDLKDGSSVEAIKNCDIPVFFAHGEADDFVPYYMVHKIADECSSEHVIFSVPEAKHGLSFVVDPEGYQKALLEFLDKHLG